ncbi:MAG: UDP-N-acetylglucosamine--N-acetylmuramyl-(pentapeptide) pyrophosphoryl-undecaprenol N-acetylglucosamine transferase, partial [Desulfobacterales bacterium]
MNQQRQNFSTLTVGAGRWEANTFAASEFQRRARPTSKGTGYRPLRIAIAGGGTGGHLFPGLAIAQEFVLRNPRNEIIFVSTGNAFEKSVLAPTDFRLHRISVEGLKGRGLWNQFKSMVKLPRAIFQSMRILQNFRPDLIVGLGSYSAGPLVMAAWLLRFPIVLHEQNILPGITNRMLSRLADRIYVSFEHTKSRFARHKALLTGNPVRKAILDCARHPMETDYQRQPFTLLIIGGSQGAHRINMAVVEALEHLERGEPLFFIHQTGAADAEVVQEAYRRQGVSGRVQRFFNDMAAQYQEAHLVLCRAGAT